MKKKNLISLTVAFAFLALSITGILLFIKQKPHFVEITHTLFGLLFVGFAIFHIINNWSSIVGYSKERKTGKLQKEWIVAASIFGVILIGGVTELLEPVAEAGRIFAAKRPPRAEQLSFIKVETNKEVGGTKVKVMIEKSKETELPLIAVWTEDSTHAFIENIFIPSKIASMPESEEEAREGHFDMADFKPESLERWPSKAKIKTPIFEGETPHDNFVINSNTSAKGKFYLMVEVKSGNKTELYESLIDPTKGEIYNLKSMDNKLLSNVIVQLNK
jgi:Domain of unknown function (DUF4405)